MKLPTLIKTGPEKIKATIARIERDLARNATKIAEEDRTIAELSFAAYEGEAGAAKRLDDARARRDRLQADRQNLAAALNPARAKLAQAEAEQDQAAGAAKRKRLRELLMNRRMEIAREVWKRMQEIRDLLIAMHDDEPEINGVRGELMNRAGTSGMSNWRDIIRPNATEQRLAEAAQAMGLTDVFPCYGVGSYGYDRRPYPETEQAACDRVFAMIGESAEQARRVEADAERERRRKAAAAEGIPGGWTPPADRIEPAA